jgi:hypothetical protein
MICLANHAGQVEELIFCMFSMAGITCASCSLLTLDIKGYIELFDFDIIHNPIVLIFDQKVKF